MSKVKTYPLNKLLTEELKDSKFRKAYDELEEEFNLAKEVIELRQAKNLSQKELADMIGTSQPSIARLESGRYKNISMAFLRKVAKALDAIPEVHLRKAKVS